jgi:hypothetical protein
MILPPYRCDMNAHGMVAVCRRQQVLAYGFQLLDWRYQGKIPAQGEKNMAGIKACLVQSLSGWCTGDSALGGGGHPPLDFG